MRKILPQIQRIHLIQQAKSQLWQTTDNQALQYLVTKRRFHPDILKKFQVGYVPQWVKAPDSQKGDVHEAAGRIIYPVRNPYNQAIAITTRDWRQQRLFGRGKFWHESFQKSFYLFGMNHAVPNLIKHKKAILVEGQHDTMMMHQHGFTMTMGVLGSAPQLHHMSFILRYCQQVFLCFDKDQGGQKAVKMALELDSQYGLQKHFGLKMYPVHMPSPQQIGVQRDKDVDPDNILKNCGKQKMLEILKRARQNVEIFS